MIHRRTAHLTRFALATLLVILATPLAANLAQLASPQAPPAWPLAAWTPIRENPVFAGTGRDTWDHKIRERGYILVGDDGTYRLWYTDRKSVV